MIISRDSYLGRIHYRTTVRLCIQCLINTSSSLDHVVTRWIGVTIQNRGVAIQNRGVAIQNRGVAIQNRGVTIQNRGVTYVPHDMMLNVGVAT